MSASWQKDKAPQWRNQRTLLHKVTISQTLPETQIRAKGWVSKDFLVGTQLQESKENQDLHQACH